MLAAAALTAPTAAADDGPYTIDGIVPDDANFAVLDDLYGNVKELGPLNNNTTKVIYIHDDAPPTLNETNPNAQVDLRRAWLDTDQDTDGDDWLYFAWERDKNTGSGFIAYEFMQDPVPAACDYDTATIEELEASCNPWANRQADDFMILWDQQGGSLDLFLRIWEDDGAGGLILGAATQLDATVSAAAYSADGFFGEAAVNLTDTIFGGSTACLSFANTIPSTVTGNSDTADYKDTILQTAPPISNCTSTTVTTPKKGDGSAITGALSIGSGVVEVKDSAVVDIQGGTSTPAGSVAFYLCKLDAPDLCTSGGTSVGSTGLSGGSYPDTVLSPSAYVTSAGRYCWRAVFSGDSANGIPGSSDSSASECFTVSPVTPSLSTTASSDVLLGNTVSDTASISGLATQPASPVINDDGTAGAAAGGTITFKLYKGTCDAGNLVYTSSAVTVSGNGDYGTPDPQYEPTSAGTYHWVAEYSGNSPNNNSTDHNTSCNDSNETVVVSTVPSTMTTAQSWVPNDTATVSASAGGDLAGSVTFKLFDNSTCTGTAIYEETVAVSGASPQQVSTSNTTAQTASGSFSWETSYASTNAAQDPISATCVEVSTLTIDNDNTD
ncbi:hypothetical protein P0L94_03325 [Microbacter sp. GSS18]|nr:hypothetical protein P0L94_03325 [Microbacter sp. GSS18]